MPVAPMLLGIDHSIVKVRQPKGSLGMATSFTCVLIGRGPQFVACADHVVRRDHRVVCVVSDCPLAIEWARTHGVDRVGQSDDYVSALGREPFDYLFSIVNHVITPAVVLDMPRLGAINYHDSLLPAYGGFHAITWAMLDGQTQHGVTWHRMTNDVDAGPCLVQESFPITEQDTVFSLSARASEIATRLFAELLPSLENGSVNESPGVPARDFRRKSDRPGYAVIDWGQPARQLLQLVRALDFATEDNWLTQAKLRMPSGDLVSVGRVELAEAANAAPGSVIRVNSDEITVQALDATVQLTELTTLEGDSISEEQFASFGVVSGAILPAHDAAQAEAAVEFDRDVATAEAFWEKRLRKLAVPQLSELKAGSSLGPMASIRVALPASVVQQSADDQRAMLVTAFAVYAARVIDGPVAVDIPLCVDALGNKLEALYSPTVPLSFEVDLEASWRTAFEQAKAELQCTANRGTYARDIWSRYASLRSRTAIERQPAFALASGLSMPAALPLGVRLLVSLSPSSEHLELRFDENAIGQLHAERLGARIACLMQAAVNDATAVVSSLPIITPSETELLLQAFQDTNSESVDVACVHDLFTAQAHRTPDKTALVYRDESLTYRELHDRSDALARHLRDLGVGPDLLVGIAIERSLDMVVGLLAILKAGGAYVPLDPAYPSERLVMMLEDSGARWLLTQRHLESRLPRHSAAVVLIDAFTDVVDPSDLSAPTPVVAATPANLAYVIFTSGSTGRPKGVMVEHQNVANFFAGMDEVIGTDPGTWLAATSISFDISVLEIFWTLTRGFETIIQEEGDRASLRKSQSVTEASSTPMGFGLFYFAADSSADSGGEAYRLLLEGAKFADSHDFAAVWTPERHFHAFGGLYPNPAVTSAALATITSRIELRGGSVVIPLHDPIRVAEEWAVVDNLSHGRVGLAFASGWHVNDFVLKPENYERRHEVMQESIDTVLRLWAGEKVKVLNGAGEEIEIGVMPRPTRSHLPIWITSAGNIETFRVAGRLGYNVLTHMVGQNLEDLGEKLAAYREARRDAGHEGDGAISVMLHTFVTDSDDKARQIARRPFGNYLMSSYDLVKVAPWMFPAFKQPSSGDAVASDEASGAFDPENFDEQDMQALLDHAFDRYFETAGLFGTPQRALKFVEKLKQIGVTEVACLVDFGIDPEVVLDNLVHLDELRRLANPSASSLPQDRSVSIREQFERHPITHFQCTPSMARILMTDGTLGKMKSLRKFMVGGEVMMPDLAQAITAKLPHTDLINMYGPTETTIWSTTTAINNGSDDITIGKPIVNTQIRILDRQLALQPLGTPGELCIGGDGVVRGYWQRPDLTAERFVLDPFEPANRLYRTGDLARYRDDGTIEYLGRLDEQVKVNGYRIELGEVESQLQRHPSVQQAAVAVKQVNGEAQLVAYAIAADAEGAAGLAPKLREHLEVVLPDYMMPQAFIFLDSLPLTPNGKIDRGALPSPSEHARPTKAEYAVPSNAMERTIAEIWQGLLGVDQVGRKDNIFDLGASSLLTVEANSRLQSVLGRKIPLVTMFRYPTIESLAGHLAKDAATAGDDVGSSRDEGRQSRVASAAARRREARARRSQG